MNAPKTAGRFAQERVSQGFFILWLLAFWPFANFIHYNQKLLLLDDVGLIVLIYLGLMALVTSTLLAFFYIIKVKHKLVWCALVGVSLLFLFTYRGLTQVAHNLIEVMPTIPWGINRLLYIILCANLGFHNAFCRENKTCSDYSYSLLSYCCSTSYDQLYFFHLEFHESR